MIPFLDMHRMHEPLTEKFLESFRQLLARSAFVNGPEVKAFETDFAKWVGTKYCIGLSSGLDALVIGLKCLGLKPGEKVIVPAMTFIATIEAVTQVGGEPVLVDVDNQGLINLDQVEAQLKNGCRFVIPVHLFGQIIDPKKLTHLAEKYDAIILEDACQAHGAAINGVNCGTIGKASAFSFYPGKNLGALGDAGALCTNDPEVDRVARALREHGQTKKYFHDYEGYTARLDNIQAAFLNIKLPKMNEWTGQRISAAKLYTEQIGNLPNFKLLSNTFDGSHVFHLLVGITDKREQLSAAFNEAKIGFGYHYPNPINTLACYKDKSWSNGQFPISDLIGNKGISLPMFPGITTDEIAAVVKVIKNVCT